jgi:hypothetical protein
VQNSRITPAMKNKIPKIPEDQKNSDRHLVVRQHMVPNALKYQCHRQAGS